MNQIGEIVDRELFICDAFQDRFSSRMLLQLIAAKECISLARLINCRQLKDIHYEDFLWFEELTNEEIEELDDEDFFFFFEEIIRTFYSEHYISEEQMISHHLEYLCVERTDSEQEDYSFPEETVKNEEALNRSINRLIQNPSTIESEIRPHKVYVVKNKDGKTFSLDSDEARSAALRRYNPDLRRKYCFCQMCKRLKSYSFIEVNNIELLPKYYFPQLRIALCLECSKKYILFRNNDKKAKKFIKAIRSSSYSGKANVSIPIDAFSSITFTAIHFAEIQRILNSTLFNE